MLWRIWSYTRPVEKPAKVPVKGILPPMVIPVATPIMLASAMPTLKKRSGNASLKAFILSEPVKPAHSPRTLSFCCPASSNPAQIPSACL